MYRTAFNESLARKGWQIQAKGPGSLLMLSVKGVPGTTTAEFVPAVPVVVVSSGDERLSTIPDWRNKVYAIPKKRDDGSWGWRLSFSILEKEYIKGHRSPSTKMCLCIVKYIAFEMGKLHGTKLKSYHLKMAWLAFFEGKSFGSDDGLAGKDEVLDKTI